jgi:hypothetical protein
MSSISQISVEIGKIRNKYVLDEVLIVFVVYISIIITLENVIILYVNLVATDGRALFWMICQNELGDGFKSGVC